jgi:hypothetical protein
MWLTSSTTETAVVDTPADEVEHAGHGHHHHEKHLTRNTPVQQPGAFRASSVTKASAGRIEMSQLREHANSAAAIE